MPVSYTHLAISELSAITGQKAVATVSKKDISNFKLRKKMPIGVMVTSVSYTHLDVYKRQHIYRYEPKDQN